MLDAQPLLGALPPQQYDFKNWDYFETEVMRYHNAVHPERDLVIDKIGTFRSLMTPDVIEHLGSLVHLHPRFRTRDGWEEWLQAAADALRSKDKTIKDPITAEAWVEQYQNHKANARQLWTGLDLLASKGDISSTRQRELFWEAHSWEKQALLLERCPYFDPRDDVWNEESKSSHLMAEQLLCRIMALSNLDDTLVTQKRWLTVWIVAFLTLLTGGIVFLALLGHVQKNQDGKFAGFLIAGLYSVLFGVGAFIASIVMYKSVQDLRRSQREYRLHERV